MIFKHWRHYLKDLTYSVKVLFNYINFKFFITIKHLNQHQTWWAEVLSVYNFVLLHWLSKLNFTNAFSCHANYVNFYYNEILLSILQQKLCHEIQKNWKFEINNIEKTLLICVKMHDFSSKCVNDKRCSLY